MSSQIVLFCYHHKPQERAMKFHLSRVTRRLSELMRYSLRGSLFTKLLVMTRITLPKVLAKGHF